MGVLFSTARAGVERVIESGRCTDDEHLSASLPDLKSPLRVTAGVAV